MTTQDTNSEAAAQADGLTLEELAERAHADGRLALDTEFVSEGRYRPLLCLVQAAVSPPGSDERAHGEVFDPIEGFDHELLGELVADPDVGVVVHSAAQDVVILRRVWGIEPRNLFDTQIAAGFAGYSAQTGYGNLLARVTGVHLSKSAGFTRWDRRPLTPEQIDYARSDVEDLLVLADRLKERLEDSGRLEWAREECRRLEELSDERDPDEVWRRLPRVAQLRPRARAVAKELAAWRERTAAAENRPVGSILSDVALVEVARRQPKAVAELGAIRGVRPDLGRRRGGIGPRGSVARPYSKSSGRCGPTQATTGRPSIRPATSRTSSSVTASSAAIASSGERSSPKVTLSRAVRLATAFVLSSMSTADPAAYDRARSTSPSRGPFSARSATISWIRA